MTDFSRKFAAAASSSSNGGSSYVTIIDIDLETNGYEGAHVELDVIGSGATDNYVVACYSSLDGTNFSDVPFYSFSITTPGTTADQVGFIVKEFLHVRIKGKSSAGNDTFSASASHQCWEWTDA